MHVILDWFSCVIFTNNFWQELDLAYLVPLLLALLWFVKHVVLLQVGRAAVCATPPFICPVTSSLLRTQATLSHVREIHFPSPSWLPPVLCQYWRSHGTPAPGGGGGGGTRPGCSSSPVDSKRYKGQKGGGGGGVETIHFSQFWWHFFC